MRGEGGVEGFPRGLRGLSQVINVITLVMVYMSVYVYL